MFIDFYRGRLFSSIRTLGARAPTATPIRAHGVILVFDTVPRRGSESLKEGIALCAELVEPYIKMIGAEV
jgi:hypothetical protein